MIAHSILAELASALEADPALAARLRRVLGAEPRSDAERFPLKKAGVPVRTLRRAIAAGELAAERVGREYFVRREDLEAWFTSRRAKPAEKKPREPSAAERAIERARREGSLRLVGGAR